MIMNLHEQINRIKILMETNVSNPFYKTIGNVNEPPGIKIIVSNDSEDMGHTFLINFDDAKNWDWDIPRFYNGKEKYCRANCEDDFFNIDNSLYLHDLQVYDDFKGKGYSNGIMDYSNDIAKNLGKKYILLITSCDNTIAQNLYKKHGYLLHQTDNNKDFYFKKV